MLVLGYIERGRVFRVIRFDRWSPGFDPNHVMNEISRLCSQFRVRIIGADGGGFGLSHNRLLLARLHESGYRISMYSILYSQSDQEPVQDGMLWKWTVNRSVTIGTLISRIKKGLLRFPRVAESNSFLNEFTCEVAIYDEEMRSIRYSKPESARDDALHATNYCQLIGLRMPPHMLA